MIKNRNKRIASRLLLSGMIVLILLGIGVYLFGCIRPTLHVHLGEQHRHFHGTEAGVDPDETSIVIPRRDE